MGRSSGFIIAASTVGSIAGVFVAGFVLIDQMKVSHIFRVMGGLTVLLGLLVRGARSLAAAGRGVDRKGADAMKHARASLWLCFAGALLASSLARADLVFEVTSPYHHIRVVDENGLRVLYFDDAPESRMSMQDPLRGHFEYTEYFHMAWLWNTQLTNVLMVGLGGRHRPAGLRALLSRRDRRDRRDRSDGGAAWREDYFKLHGVRAAESAAEPTDACSCAGAPPATT